jgi:hypothetical protein
VGLVKEVGTYCETIANFIQSQLNLQVICENEQQTQGYEVNFINMGVNEGLDNKTESFSFSGLLIKLHFESYNA